MFTIIRRKKNKNYTVISNLPLTDEKMSLKAKGLFAMIMSLPDDWNFSIKGIASLCKESERSIRSIMAELKVCGYCKVVSIRDEHNRIKGWDYQFFESKITESTDNQPQCKNPQCGNSHNVENAGQLNTNNNKVLNRENLSLSLPFIEAETIELWNKLLEQPKWRRKKADSLRITIDKLQGYPESFIRDRIKTAIECNWGSIVSNGTPKAYQEWCNSKDVPEPTAPKKTRRLNLNLNEK